METLKISHAALIALNRVRDKCDDMCIEIEYLYAQKVIYSMSHACANRFSLLHGSVLFFQQVQCVHMTSSFFFTRQHIYETWSKI